jgi:hypothetical protein
MESFMQFWTWVYVVGLGAFVLMAIVILPLGARDLLRLLRELDSDKRADDDEID